VHFYRVMLCIVQSTPSRDVHLSVCLPSATRRYSVKTVIHILQLFTILVFPYQTAWQYFRRGLPNGGGEVVSNTRRYEKITIFDQYLALSRKSCKIEPQLLWNANRKPYASFWMEWYQFEWPKWSLTKNSKSRCYSTSNNSKMVQDRGILTMADQ